MIDKNEPSRGDRSSWYSAVQTPGLKNSQITAIFVVVLLTLWMLSGLFFRSSDTDIDTAGPGHSTGHSTGQSPGNSTGNSDEKNRELMKVQVTRAVLSPMNRVITLQGQVEPNRKLSIRSETSGTVISVPISKGNRVKRDDLIAKLSLDGRDAKLSEARAKIRTAISEQKAAKKLQKQGLQSQLKLEQAQASLASARTTLKLTEIDIRNTEIVAPFDAILNSLAVEQGQQVERGMVIAELIDDSSFKVTATATQQSLKNLSVGQNITAKLITGESLKGEISYISAVANPATRSFSVEAEVDNTHSAAAAGVSASLLVPVESVSAVFVSPSTLALDEHGDIGVKTVNTKNIVEFHKVALVQTTQKGAWVTGIPAESNIIILGQGFVNPDQKVEPVTELADGSS